jgi:CheY-like chemotaxis protein
LESQRSERQHTEKALNVVVVDDNSDAADTLRRLLQMWGHNCQVAYDGETGFRMACDYHPDCMLLDLAMPGMDGYTLARKLRMQPGLEHTRLVALTAYFDDLHVRLAYEAGFDDYLVKPMQIAGFDRLKEILRAVARLTVSTEEIARQNADLAAETRELVKEVRDDVAQVKKDIGEIKHGVKDLKHKVGRDEVALPTEHVPDNESRPL